MKTAIIISGIVIAFAVQALAGMEMLTVGTSSAVGISANVRNTYRADDTTCLVGPI